MFEDNDTEGNKNINENNNNINDRYFNIDNNPSSKNKINSNENNFFFDFYNNNLKDDEDLDIELESVSKKIPIDNYVLNDNGEKFIKVENNNTKKSPLQRKKRSKIHRHKSYDNWHNYNIEKNNQNNNNINYTKVNNQKSAIPNIKLVDDNTKTYFNELNENPNNKTEYDLYRINNDKKYEKETKRNTIDVNAKKISYFENFENKIDMEPFDNIYKINDENKNYLKNIGKPNLINLKTANNINKNNINIGNDELHNLINRNKELDNNFKDIFDKIENINTNIHKDENKYNDDESLVQKIENKLKNKFEANNVDEYYNRTPNIKNNYINYFDNDYEGNDSESNNKNKSSNVDDVLFKPTNIINNENKNEINNDYLDHKNQNTKLVNQIKKLKEENRILKAGNEKLSKKILQIEKEQKKKKNDEYSLLQKIKKMENQLKQKNILITKLSNKNNFNNIKKIKIISFFIRNRKYNYQKNLFRNLKIKKVENIRFFPDYLKESEYEKEDYNDMNTEENLEDENNDNEFEEDEGIENIVNEKEDFGEEDEEIDKIINNNKKETIKKNNSDKVFSPIINNIQNNFKRLSSNPNNNTININKNYYNKEKYNHSLPVSNKKKSNNSGKKSIYEFFEKSSNAKNNIKTNKNNNKNIISKKNSANKYNQNYNINFYKNNCYNNNFVSLFNKEDYNNNKNIIDNNDVDNINKKKEKEKTSLIMSVLNDNLLGNMNFNLVKTNIGSNNS